MNSSRIPTAAAALLLVAAAAPAADAAKGGNGHGNEHGNQPSATTPAPATCDYPAPRQVFSAWNDRKLYVLTESGGLEQGDAGWTLGGGAAVVEGNEPFRLNDAADHQSLSLPAGSSATSPATCFSAQNPVFRLVARTDGTRRSRLKVEVLYTSGKGKKASRVAGRLRAGETWKPTKKLSLAIGRAKGRGKLTTGTIAFRFTPVGAPATWQIDDVFLDPRARR